MNIKIYGNYSILINDQIIFICKKGLLKLKNTSLTKLQYLKNLLNKDNIVR